jgi:hypothetical protein
MGEKETCIKGIIGGVRGRVYLFFGGEDITRTNLQIQANSRM